MTQLEHVVLAYIERHPRCTEEEILDSFARAPEPDTLQAVIESLAAQQLIQSFKLKPDELTAYAPRRLEA